MQKELTISILTFNSAKIIAECLSNFSEDAFDKYEIFVIDNASKDNTLQIVKENFPKVQIIANKQNIGFGRANNIVLRNATTEFSLILNPDAFIEELEIEKCLEILKKNKFIAIASPIIFGSKEAANSFQIAAKKEETYSSVKFLVGGVMFLRNEVFQKIGFFDEQYFMFAEDGEICDRAIKSGFMNAEINIAKAWHLGANSSEKTLQIYFRRFWHLGWSKTIYKKQRKNLFNWIRSTLRIFVTYLAFSLFYLMTGNLTKSLSKFAFAYGNICALIGVKAFKKDGSPQF